jgi:hypothetical protein
MEKNEKRPNPGHKPAKLGRGGTTYPMSEVFSFPECPKDQKHYQDGRYFHR